MRAGLLPHEMPRGTHPFTDGRKPRRHTGTSAISRKNKVQRCGVCGGLGHKARTCSNIAARKASAAELRVLLSADEENRDLCNSPDTPGSVRKMAAYGLLTLAESLQPPPMSLSSSPASPPKFKFGALAGTAWPAAAPALAA